jgi:hypothetical protein
MTLLKAMKADHEKAKALLHKILDAEEGKERKIRSVRGRTDGP